MDRQEEKSERKKHEKYQPDVDQRKSLTHNTIAEARENEKTLNWITEHVFTRQNIEEKSIRETQEGTKLLNLMMKGKRTMEHL